MRLAAVLVAPVRLVWRRLRPTATDDEEGKGGSPAETPGEFEQLGVAMQSIRDSLRTMGAAFAAAGGVVVAGLGYTQLHQAFPLPTDGGMEELAAAALLVAGAVLALTGAAYFSARFYIAQRRIPMQAKGEGVGLDTDEKTLRREIFEEDAHAEEAHDLYALELRALRLSRISRRRSDPALEAEAARLDVAIRLTFRRAAAAILERRAHGVYSGARTALAIALFITGVILVFGVADWAEGERDQIELRSKCADAELKGAFDACNPVRADTTGADATTGAETSARRRATTQTTQRTLCLRRVLRLAAGRDKEVVAAAVNLCGGGSSD